jgi:hypothetical protein
VNERQVDVIQRLRARLQASVNPEDPSQRAEHIAAFQAEVWSTGEQLGSERLDRLLRDLAFDLDFYEPEPRIRMEDPSYFGEERLQQSLDAALGDAAWEDSPESHVTDSP